MWLAGAAHGGGGGAAQVATGRWLCAVVVVSGGGVTHPFWSLPGVTSHHMGGEVGWRCAAQPE